MAITKQKKEEIIQDLTNKIKDAKGVVFANFEGLSVSDADEFRIKCDEGNVTMNVAKKTLVDIAGKGAGVEGLDARSFEGSVATFTSSADEVTSAKIVAEFAKNHDPIKILAGVMEGKLMSQEEVITLSKLLSKEELYAKLVGSINAPVSGFVNVLAGNMRGLVNVLNSIQESKS